MSRILAVVLALWLGSAAAFAAPLRLLYVDPPGAPVDVGAHSFQQAMQQRGIPVVCLPNGRWQGQSLGELDILQQVQSGAVDMCIVTTAPLGNYSRSMEILDTPFLFHNYADVYRTLDGPLGRELLNGLSSSGLRGLDFMDSGFRMLSSGQPLATLADLHNKRIRVMQNEIYCDFIKLIGAVPIPSSVQVINDMARKHYIDAADRSFPTYWEFGTNHVERYVLDTRHAYAAEALIINDARFRQLSAAQQGAVMAAGRIARAAQRRCFRQREAQVRQACRKQGIPIRELSAADTRTMRLDCAPIYQRLRSRYPTLMQALTR